MTLCFLPLEAGFVAGELRFSRDCCQQCCQGLRQRLSRQIQEELFIILFNTELLLRKGKAAQRPFNSVSV